MRADRTGRTAGLCLRHCKSERPGQLSFALQKDKTGAFCTCKKDNAGWSNWELVGLITRRLQVQVLPPLQKVNICLQKETINVRLN